MLLLLLAPIIRATSSELTEVMAKSEVVAAKEVEELGAPLLLGLLLGLLLVLGLAAPVVLLPSAEEAAAVSRSLPAHREQPRGGPRRARLSAGRSRCPRGRSASTARAST